MEGEESRHLWLVVQCRADVSLSNASLRVGGWGDRLVVSAVLDAALECLDEELQPQLKRFKAKAGPPPLNGICTSRNAMRTLHCSGGCEWAGRWLWWWWASQLPMQTLPRSPIFLRQTARLEHGPSLTQPHARLLWPTVADSTDCPSLECWRCSSTPLPYSSRAPGNDRVADCPGVLLCSLMAGTSNQ